MATVAASSALFLSLFLSTGRIARRFLRHSYKLNANELSMNESLLQLFPYRCTLFQIIHNQSCGFLNRLIGNINDGASKLRIQRQGIIQFLLYPLKGAYCT